MCAFVCKGASVYARVFVCLRGMAGQRNASGSRLAEPSQWTSSFTLQGNSSLIRKEKERKKEMPKPNV